MTTKERKRNYRPKGFKNKSDTHIEGQRLVALHNLKRFEVADDNPDVRDWDVYSENGIKFGRVDDLIIDTAEMKVRYLDVEINEALLNKKEKGAHLLVPIGMANLDDNHDDVWIEGMHITALFRSPLYWGGGITRDFENTVWKALAPEKNQIEQVGDREYYKTSEYDGSNFYNRKAIPGEDKRIKDSEGRPDDSIGSNS